MPSLSSLMSPILNATFALAALIIGGLLEPSFERRVMKSDPAVRNSILAFMIFGCLVFAFWFGPFLMDTIMGFAFGASQPTTTPAETGGGHGIITAAFLILALSLGRRMQNDAGAKFVRITARLGDAADSVLHSLPSGMNVNRRTISRAVTVLKDEAKTYATRIDTTLEVQDWVEPGSDFFFYSIETDTTIPNVIERRLPPSIEVTVRPIFSKKDSADNVRPVEPNDFAWNAKRQWITQTIPLCEEDAGVWKANLPNIKVTVRIVTRQKDVLIPETEHRLFPAQTQQTGRPSKVGALLQRESSPPQDNPADLIGYWRVPLPPNAEYITVKVEKLIFSKDRAFHLTAGDLCQTWELVADATEGPIEWTSLLSLDPAAATSKRNERNPRKARFVITANEADEMILPGDGVVLLYRVKTARDGLGNDQPLLIENHATASS